MTTFLSHGMEKGIGKRVRDDEQSGVVAPVQKKQKNDLLVTGDNWQVAVPRDIARLCPALREPFLNAQLRSPITEATCTDIFRMLSKAYSKANRNGWELAVILNKPEELDYNWDVLLNDFQKKRSFFATIGALELHEFGKVCYEYLRVIKNTGMSRLVRDNAKKIFAEHSINYAINGNIISLDTVIHSIAFDNNSAAIFFASEDKVYRADATKASPVEEKYHSDSAIKHLWFSPDGKYLVISDLLGHNIIKSATAPNQVAINLNGAASAVAISHDNDQIIYGLEKDIVIYDARNIAAPQEIKRIVQAHGNTINALACSFDGDFFASGSDDHTIKVWNRKNYACHQTLNGHASGVKMLSYSHCGKFLLSAGSDRAVKVWDLKNGQCIHTITLSNNSEICALAFSIGSDAIAVGYEDGAIRVWETKTYTLVAGLNDHDSNVFFLQFSNDGREIQSASVSAKIIKYKLKSKTVEQITGQCATRLFSSSFFGNKDRRFEIRLQLGIERIDLPYERTLTSLTYHPDGKSIVFASRYDAYSTSLYHGGPVCELENYYSFNSSVEPVQFSHNGKYLALCTQVGDNQVKNCITNEYISLPRGEVFSVAFSPDSRFLAFGLLGRDIRIYDCETGNLSREIFLAHDYAVSALAYSPCGRFLFSGSHDKTIKMWDTSTGKCLKTLRGHTHYVTTVACSYDGKLLASGSGDQTIKIWDIGTGECINVVDTGDWVWALTFYSAEGVVSGGYKGGMHVWDFKSGKLKEINLHEDKIISIVFHATHNTIVSVSRDGEVMTWVP